MMFIWFCSVNLISALLWTVSGFLVERKDINAEETGNLLEEDIVGEIPPITRNAFTNPRLRWPGGVVPYEIAFDYPKHELLLLMEAIEEYNTRTCTKFREKVDQDVDYISILGNGKGCRSYVGRRGGKQELNLATGFTHEQNRIERDDYITVEWGNIQEGKKYNFYKVGSNLTSDFGVPYDYKSIMHYPAYAFSKNHEPTLVPKKENVVLGLRYGFSEGDIQKVNAMYCSSSV